MKKMLLKWLKPFIVSLATKKLQDEEFRNYIITELDKKVDIPKLGSQEERKLITSMVDATTEIALNVIKDI
jgi:hypothetical protein